MNRALNTLLPAAWIISGLCFVLISSQPRASYFGFTPIQWIESVRCDEKIATAGEYPHVRFREVRGHGKKHFGYCHGAFTLTEGDRAVLEYQVLQLRRSSEAAAEASVEPSAIGMKAKVKIAIDSPDGARLHTASPVNTGNSWRRLEFDVQTQGEHRIHLVNKETAPVVLRIRDKVDSFNTAGLHEKVKIVFAGRLARYGVQLAFAVLSFLLLLRVQSQAVVVRYLFFLMLAACCFYRVHMSFAIDEWDLLIRLYSEGSSSALVTHNEHFIPVFVLFYYLEYLLFSGTYAWYVLVSLMLHSCTAILVQSFVRRLLGAGAGAEKTSYWASVVYLLSCLHAESIQWTICQSTLPFMMFGMLSLIYSWDFIMEGGGRRLLVACLTLLFALFSFGAAFILLLQIPMFMLYQYWLHREAKDSRLLVDRGVKLLLGIAVVGATAAVLYWLKREGFGIGVDDLNPNPLSDILSFAAVGAQFGTVLRGSGLYPFEGFGQVAAVLPFVPSPALVAFLCGSLLSLLLLLLYRRQSVDGTSALLFWLFGQSCILMPIALVAIGRAGYGLHHSYVLRYQSPAVFGLCLLFIPLLHFLLKKSEGTQGNWLGKWTLAVIPVLFLFSQLHFLRAHILYTYNGALQETFVEQLSYWNAINGRRPLDPEIAFEGVGTEYEGLQPLFYWGHPGNTGAILPFAHPDTMLDILGNNPSPTLEQISRSE